MRQRAMVGLACVVAALGTACGSDPEPDPAVVPKPEAALTWYRDIEPIVQVKCDGCHAAGGIGPVVFNESTVQALAGLMTQQVSSGLMPPWQPSDLGPPLDGERTLSKDEIDAITAWAADGAPLGDPADHQAREPQKTFNLTDPTISVKLPQPYEPNKELEDDVRCFVIDLPADKNIWVRAARFVIDQKSSVHHIGAAVVAADQAKAARAIDDTELDSDGQNRPGYNCPGGVRAEATAGFGAGGPGSDGTVYADGVGVFVPAGSAVIISMHYYTPQAKAPDQSGLELWVSEKPLRAFVPVSLFAPTELPCPTGLSDDPASPCSRQYAVENVGAFAPAVTQAINDYRLKFCNTTLEELFMDLDFQMSTPDKFLIKTECVHKAPYDGTAHMVTTHMHTRGASSRIEVEDAGGAWKPLLDIPRWDWHWESTYALTDGVPVAKDQNVKITCTFDNGAASQPPLPGQSGGGIKADPRYVLTGEGRLDEMCGGSYWIARDTWKGGSYESLCAEAKAIYDAACPGYEMVSQNVFMSGPCDADRERYAILLSYTPDDLIPKYWCDPPPSGAGSNIGSTCKDTVYCALGCQFGACAQACADAASPVGAHYFDRLLACSDPYCADEKDNPEGWGACAGIACKFEVQKCFTP